MKPEYAEKRKICYIDTESFIAHTKMGEIYNHIAKNFFETRFDTANYELDTLLPKGKKTKKVIDLKKDWLGWKNQERICWIKNKNLWLLNRRWQYR